jgi:non-ribosomal peptide synthetase component F
VSAVAVMKAGGARVMIDSAESIEQACSSISQAAATLVLTSSGNLERATQFQGVQPVIIDEAYMDGLPDPEGGLTLSPQQVKPSNLAYVFFTSGSTGMPKGVEITHSCFASAIRYQQKALGFKPGQSVYDFASYSFDVS